jgi:hypothetical protein
MEVLINGKTITIDKQNEDFIFKSKLKENIISALQFYLSENSKKFSISLKLSDSAFNECVEIVLFNIIESPINFLTTEVEYVAEDFLNIELQENLLKDYQVSNGNLDALLAIHKAYSYVDTAIYKFISSHYNKECSCESACVYQKFMQGDLNVTDFIKTFDLD